MALKQLMTAQGPDIYYDPAFRNVLEDHLSYLRALQSTVRRAVSPGEAYRFEYDLFGLLKIYGVEAHLHWVVMRLNNYTSPDEFRADVTELLVPDATVVDRIRQSHQATRRIA